MIIGLYVIAMFLEYDTEGYHRMFVQTITFEPLNILHVSQNLNTLLFFLVGTCARQSQDI